MAQRVVPAIKLKDVVGEPTVAIQAALNDGRLTKNPNGLPAPGQFVPLGYFVGFVADQVDHTTKRKDPSGMETTQSWPKLVGQFKAWSVDPARDEHVSAHAFLMDHITRHLGNTIRDAKAQDPDARLEVLFEVGAETSDKSSAGFTWALRNMAEPTVQADPLATLALRVQGKLTAPALPAPEVEAEAEADAEGDGEAEKSVEAKQAEQDNADAVSKETGAGKQDHGNKVGGHGKRR